MLEQFTRVFAFNKLDLQQITCAVCVCGGRGLYFRFRDFLAKKKKSFGPFKKSLPFNFLEYIYN